MPITLRIAELTSTPTVQLDKLDTSWCAQRAGAVFRALDAEMDVTTSAVKAAEVVDVTGEVRGTFGFDCSRCAEPAVLTVCERFEHHFVGPGQLDAEEALDGFDVDPDVSEHDGVTVDLGDLAIEHTLLALPAVPLCDEACKGLCPQCGTNLNRERCSCLPTRETAAAWEKLRDFKVIGSD